MPSSRWPTKKELNGICRHSWFHNVMTGFFLLFLILSLIFFICIFFTLWFLCVCVMVSVFCSFGGWGGGTPEYTNECVYVCFFCISGMSLFLMFVSYSLNEFIVVLSFTLLLSLRWLFFSKKKQNNMGEFQRGDGK